MSTVEPPRVLVVDDNPAVRGHAVALLLHVGALYEEASDGAEAVQMLADRDDRFDLVLMDIQMPVMDGLAATARIRELEREGGVTVGMRLPVVALTSEDISNEESNLRRLGLDGVIRKPLTLATLRTCLLQCCPGMLR